MITIVHARCIVAGVVLSLYIYAIHTVLKRKERKEQRGYYAKAVTGFVNGYYGIVELFKTFRLNDIRWSIVAISRLQHITEDEEDSISKNGNILIDREVLDELAHYATFANAAYGWKGAILDCRLPFFGSKQVDDIVAAKYTSHAYRPVSYWCLFVTLY